jgi:glutamate-1-semialdehyde 2,1-aminomutase
VSREELVAEYAKKVEEVYQRRTLKSREVVEVGKNYTPDGDYRAAIWWRPYPTVMARGDGCKLYDVDGNEYLDYSNCWTVMVLGMNHPKVVEAVSKAAQSGFAMAAPSADAYEWAKILCDRVTSVERVRFCCSGAEAVMFAIRGTRAYTGKDKILKMEGNYHGTYDPMETQVGWRRLPRGISQSAEKDVLVTPFNDKEAAERIIKENKDELAAVIVEGVMGSAGLIPPEDDYLEFLRKVSAENGVLMIVDEVISFRLSTGGAQQIYDVRPDLTVFGKTIGGGLPVGAFGGSEEVMRVFSPNQKAPAHHSGTLLATRVGVAAGIVALKEMTKETLDRINSLGESLRDRLKAVLSELGLKAQITGYGSLQQIHFTPQHVSNAATAFFTADRDVLRLFHLAMLNRGVFIPARGFFSVTVPMTEVEIDKAASATADALAELKPLIEEIAPQLIA